MVLAATSLPFVVFTATLWAGVRVAAAVAMGVLVGLTVGSAVGSSVGLTVGSAVGSSVGLTVGSAVGVESLGKQTSLTVLSRAGFWFLRMSTILVALSLMLRPSRT